MSSTEKSWIMMFVSMRDLGALMEQKENELDGWV